MQLFISKDTEGKMLYTYINKTDQITEET